MRGLRSGELAWILPDYTSRALGVYAVHPSRSYPDAKVRLWVEMLREQLPSTLMQNESELRQFSRH
jgi:DNA-binding transcriptional LysR family regulator